MSRHLLLVSALLAIAALAVAPGGTIPNSNAIDKPLHVAAFLALALLCGVVFTSWRARIAGLSGLLGYGLGLEMVQAFLPQHELSAGDMVANLVGLVIGVLLLVAAERGRTQIAPRSYTADANAHAAVKPVLLGRSQRPR